MWKRVAKAVAYWKAPKKTYALLHPVNALKLGALALVGRRIFGGSKA